MSSANFEKSRTPSTQLGETGWVAPLGLISLLWLAGCSLNEGTCTDGRLNGRETDLDCGGATCIEAHKK